MHPSLRALLGEDLRTHGGRRDHVGYRALRIHRWGAWRDGLRRGPWRKVLALPYELACRWLRNRHRIELHHSASIGRRVRLSHHGGIVVGNDSVIGDDCIVGADVTMAKTKVGIPGRPVIGHRVVIGPGAVFVGGVTVGDGAIVGPNVAVFADVPAGTSISAPPPSVAPRPLEGTPRRRESPGTEMRVADLPPGSIIRGNAYVSASAPPRIDGPVELGDGCVFGERAFLGWVPPDRRRSDTGPTRLGARVRIGAGVVVVQGVSIGDDVHVGPNVVVEADLTKGTAVLCPPPRVFRPLRDVPVPPDA
jgi:serine O-acetyltransferase